MYLNVFFANFNPNLNPNCNSNPKTQKPFWENKMTSFFFSASVQIPLILLNSTIYI